MKIQHRLLPIYLRVPHRLPSNKVRYTELHPGGIQGIYGRASSPSSCLLPWQVVGVVEPPPSRFSFAVAPLPGMFVLQWRHPLFGWTACCMPPDHCVGIPHPQRYRHRPCFYRYAHRHRRLNRSHPHYLLRHHCSPCHHLPLHPHCSLRRHQMRGCHPRFLLLAHLQEHVRGLRGDLSLPLPEIRALGSAAAWPSPMLAA